jgi:hypothetical protein
MFAKIRQFLQHVVPGVIRPMRVLWNEVIGFVFLAIAALLAIPAIVREVRSYEGGAEATFRIVVAGVFAVIMIWFGIGSFLRARRISRS